MLPRLPICAGPLQLRHRCTHLPHAAAPQRMPRADMYSEIIRALPHAHTAVSSQSEPGIESLHDGGACFSACSDKMQHACNGGIGAHICRTLQCCNVCLTHLAMAALAAADSAHDCRVRLRHGLLQLLLLRLLGHLLHAETFHDETATCAYMVTRPLKLAGQADAGGVALSGDMRALKSHSQKTGEAQLSQCLVQCETMSTP